VLIAVAASGTTPFTLACLRDAKRKGGSPSASPTMPHAAACRKAHHPILLERIRADCGLDAHKGGNRATHRAQPVVVLADDPLGSRL